MTFAISTMPCPIICAIFGIRPSTPVTITPSAATNAVAPAAPAVARAVNPAAIAVTPIPIPAVATPNNAKAPANPKSVGINGDNNAPATPITANAAPKVIKLFAMLPTLREPNDFMLGANTANAAAAISKAAEPLAVPFMACKPIANAPNDRPSVSKPFPMFSQLMDPNDFNTGANIANEAAINAICPPNLAIEPPPLFMIFADATNIVTSPSIPAPPLANSPQLMEPNCLPTAVSTPIAADITSI